MAQGSGTGFSFSSPQDTDGGFEAESWGRPRGSGWDRQDRNHQRPGQSFGQAGSETPPTPTLLPPGSAQGSWHQLPDGLGPRLLLGMGSEAPHSFFMEGGDSEVREPILNGAHIPRPSNSPSAWCSTAQMAWITKPWGSSSRGWPRLERGPASTSSTGSRYLCSWGTAGLGMLGLLYGLSAPQ